MQSLKHRKWVLAVMWDNFSEYRVTDLMSENVELIIQSADYLNRGTAGSALDAAQINRLEQIRAGIQNEIRPDNKSNERQ